MRNTPYWYVDAPRPDPEPVELPKSVDVAVIGAGFTGLNAALVLARKGVSVGVFEAGVLGAGASTLNGGMVGPSFHKLGVAGLRRAYGEGRSREILRESVGFVDFLDNFLSVEGIEADFKRTGRFRGALRASHYDAMARELESLQEACGVQGQMVPKADQRAETGSPRFHGGVVYQGDGALHPAKYHDELVKCVRQAGVMLAPLTPVTSLKRTKKGFCLITSRGDVDAANVAICTNGYTGSVTPEFRRRVLPLRSAMIATESLDPGVLTSLMPKGRVYGDSRRVVAYYRPSPDGSRMLFGGRATSIRDHPEANARLLQSFMGDIYPQMKDVEIEHVWSGLVAYTFDHAPHIGKRDGLWFAMGYCGSGVARSTYFGQKLGMKILGDEAGKTAFDNLNFETRRLYTGNPWFMPAVLTWHRIADKLGV